MADNPDDSLEETRAALAPTLDATAAILPLLVRPKSPRFDPGLNERWQAACKRLSSAWSERHTGEMDAIRSAIFSLLAIALESKDTHVLRLSEALASACDRLEDPTPPLRTIAALSACIECLGDYGGLEHDAFMERAGHFAGRLEASAAAAVYTRSAILDRIFVSEARDKIERLHDALSALPPDAYALKTEAEDLIQQAEHLELWGIVQMGHQLLRLVTEHNDLDSDQTRAAILDLLHALDTAIDAVDV